MSRRQVIECDRCRDPVGDGTADREKAGRVYAATLGGVDRVGTSVTPADLCAGCMDGLVQFIGGRSLDPAEGAKAAKSNVKETA